MLRVAVMVVPFSFVTHKALVFPGDDIDREGLKQD
jgi:hypothetical protein